MPPNPHATTSRRLLRPPPASHRLPPPPTASHSPLQITAHLPVVESFGFATELRKVTSGAAHPQLVFSHFEALAQDPHFEVSTEEEQEALDDGALPSVNLARVLMDEVRRRKGLRVEEKAVASATKQRTLARKK